MTKEQYYEVWYEQSTKEYFFFLNNNDSEDYAEVQIEGINLSINRSGLVTYAEIDDFVIRDTPFYIGTVNPTKVVDFHDYLIYFERLGDSFELTKKKK